MSRNKTGREEKTSIHERHIERILPYKSMLFFSLVGSSLIFLSLIFFYIMWLTKNPLLGHIGLPRPFIVSTIIFLLTSYAVTKAQYSFRSDNSQNLMLSFLVIFSLFLFFFTFQIMGWVEIYSIIIPRNIPGSITYLVIISCVHFLHLGVAFIWQFYLSLRAYDVWNDPVKSLLYFSNKFEGARIDLFATYWHYLNVLWICLYIIFLYTL